MASPLVTAGLMSVLLAAAGDRQWDPAQTKYDCRPYAEMTAGLAQRGETARAAGVVGAPSNGQVLMFFRATGGNWTIVAVDRRRQLACVGNFGTEWSSGDEAIETLMNSPIPLPPLPGADGNPND